MSTHDPHGVLLSLRWRRTRPPEQRGQIQDPAVRQVYIRLRPLPSLCCSLASFCVVFFITYHHRKYFRFTDFASDQFIFALENPLSFLNFYFMALSSDSLNPSIMSHSQPHKQNSILFFILPLINKQIPTYVWIVGLSSLLSCELSALQKVFPNSDFVAESSASMLRCWIKSQSRVFGEVEKKSFIALPGKGRHSRLLPSKTMCPNSGEFSEEFYGSGSRVGLLKRSGLL